jgi:hypothetical protein
MVKVPMAENNFAEAGEIYAQGSSVKQKGVTLSGINQITAGRRFDRRCKAMLPENSQRRPKGNRVFTEYGNFGHWTHRSLKNSLDRLQAGYRSQL